MTNLILTFPALIREKVLKVCADIAAKDATFRYREAFEADELAPLNKIIIENPDKDVAWKRGYWFKNKVHKAVHFEVKEQNHYGRE